ncbi:hypothetical protein GQ55_5G366500 [Panicum hallii var. hallii]|uniref:Uncharacterized protein n=1 Tax=Panicum hallii var. hallii TaxID=1504633 RepID=A0A2T7DMJ0_9POAL|nr:hypothetical protein GQ55_5G366500 [Panicum hallii var. hallii]
MPQPLPFSTRRCTFPSCLRNHASSDNKNSIVRTLAGEGNLYLTIEICPL